MKLSQQLTWQPLRVGRSFGAAGFCSCFSSSSMLVRLSTPHSAKVAWRLCCWSLKLTADCRHACMRIAVCVAQCCCRDGSGSPFDSQTRTFGCAQHGRRRVCSRWRFMYARMTHCASVVLSRKCGPSCLAYAVCQCLPRFNCCWRSRPRCDVGSIAI